jgi:hypothetical protein
MNWPYKVLNFLGRILLPARLRPTVLQSRLQSTLDRTVAGMEKGATKATGDAERLDSGAAPKTGRLAAFFRWFLHFLLISGILILLYFVNRWCQLERVLRSDWPALHAYWLPLLFLLLYLMAWLAWWIWELTGPEKLSADFPDIDQAFREGLASLAEAGIDMRDAPVFLVVGRPLEGEDNAMLAAQFGFKIRDVPRWAEAPIRFSANDHAVFLATSGASTFGRYVSTVIEDAQEAVSRRERLESAAGDLRADHTIPVAEEQNANAAGATPAATPEATAIAEAATAAPASLADPELRVIGLLGAEGQAAKAPQTTRRRVFLKNKALVREQMARMQHVCQLLRRQRRPFCPINGILVMLPMAVTDADDDAASATSACQLDLAVVQETLQVRCPVFVMACDAEQIPGFREFMQRVPAAQRQTRLGQRFPLSADVEPGGLPDMVQDGVGWFTHTFLPSVVYNLFRLESAGSVHTSAPQLPETIAGNHRLYQLLAEMRLRRNRLTRFLTRGLMLDGQAPFLLGGFYVAATGPDADRDRGFAAGVFQRLPENQNAVAWSRDATEQEADFTRWTRYGYVLFVALVLVLGFLIYRLWFG